MNFELTKTLKALSFILSLFLVGFGQPAWLPVNGLIASCIGYALFWRVLIAYPQKSKRFVLGFVWFFCVQLIQMSWFLSHPFFYIIGVYLFIATWLGSQFGLLSILIKQETFKKSLIFSMLDFLKISALWTIFEWSRLFLLSGLSWNPAGLALTSNVYALQMASLFGVYGLTFWVLLVNFLGLYAWIHREEGSRALRNFIVFLAAALFPFAYGAIHLTVLSNQIKQSERESLTALLVQTAFPVEESGQYNDNKALVDYVIGEWQTILAVTKQYYGKPIQLMVFPEFVVPFGTYSFVYSLNKVVRAFEEAFGRDELKKLPPLEYPYATWERTPEGVAPLVNNAFWIQGIANIFRSDIVAGLEDAAEVSPGKIEYYSSAQLIHPQEPELVAAVFPQLYAKRILVPMGEYIPFDCCKKLAERYGVFGSFTPGSRPEIMITNHIPFSPSICYEETYGDLIREGRISGAHLLVNLTSDVWYPNSKLPRQHLDHARLRTVENGVPLIRACNTGITAAIDSFGRTIAVLGGNDPESFEWKAGALLVDVPIDTYSTVYSKFGDKLIIAICFFFLTSFLIPVKAREGTCSRNDVNLRL